jgi:hypothetical protein
MFRVVHRVAPASAPPDPSSRRCSYGPDVTATRRPRLPPRRTKRPNLRPRTALPSPPTKSSEEESIDPIPEVGEIPGAEASIFSDELHDIELPAPGTAIAIVDGERFEASVIDNCRVQEQMAGTAFEIGTNVSASENGEIYMSARRTETSPDRAAEMGMNHESEGFTIILSRDERMEWEASRSFHRAGPDDPVREDAPVVRVEEQGEGYAVTVKNHAMLTNRRLQDAGAVAVVFAAVCE